MVETPVVETPVVEEPVVEEPVIEPEEIIIEEPVEVLSIKEFKGEVYPYTRKMKNYLKVYQRKEADKKPDVKSYYEGTLNPGVDTVIEWSCTRNDVISYIFEYGLKEDFSDATPIELTSVDTCYSVNNLYKAATYYVRVTAKTQSGDFVDTSSFTTTALGARVMTVDGVHNVRDIGGYKTADGKTTLQGMIYRGGQLDGTYVDKPVNITEKGIDTMLNVMKIRHDMDLRGINEQGLPNESPLPGVTFDRYGFTGYNMTTDTDSGKENIRKIFSALANPDNYPVYIHCQGGADRTGVLCFMINSLLGVSLDDIINDYETTTFSLYGTRSTKSGAYVPYHDKVRQVINKYDGETHTEKVENLLLDTGVTPEEIASIRSIMIPE